MATLTSTWFQDTPSLSSPAVSQSRETPEQDYPLEVIERVWQTAQQIPGNDPNLWRKDDSGAWIHRHRYRDRHSEFGWEIADCHYTLDSFGLASLRPMQWQNHLDFLMARRQSMITADGLRNTRRLL